MKSQVFVAWASVAALLAFMSPASAADEVHFTLTGPDSATFDWRGSNSADNKISYGTCSGCQTNTVTAYTPSPLPISSNGPFFEAKLTGLAYNTVYYYRIGSNPEKSFKTPPAPGGSGFVVVAEGDVGTSALYSRMPIVQNMIAAIVPDLALIVGDLTYANSYGQAEVDRHFNDVMVWSQATPYMPAWGNHEWDASTDDMRNYLGRFAFPNPNTSPVESSFAPSCPQRLGEDWYWFDYGNTRFIAYPEPFGACRTYSSDNADWHDWFDRVQVVMQDAQSNANLRFIVTFGHRPAYSSGNHPGETTLRNYLDYLGDHFSKYVLNLNGHSHNYERSAPQHGVTHLTVGTGGATLEQEAGECLWSTCPPPSWSAARFMRLGVTKLVFGANGISGQFICGPAGGGVNDVTCNQGDVIDAFTMGSVSSTPTASLIAQPTAITAGQSSTLTWDSANATSCKGINFSTNDLTRGTATVSPATTTTYSVTCTGAGGTSSPATATVTVATGGVSIHLDLNSGSSGPTASGYTGVPLVAYSAVRGYGWQSIAAMDSRNRTGVATLVGSLGQDFHKPTGASGSYDSTFRVDLPNGAYNVTVYLGDGDATLTNQYVDAHGTNVVEPVSTTTCATSVTTCSRSFTFPANVTNGQLNLRFYTTNATSVYYGYIAVEGIDIQSTGAVSPIATLSASPTSIVSGQSSTLSWESAYATSCTGSGFSTGGATSGTLIVSPTATTTYSITCDGSGGTSSPASATVTVAAGTPPTATLTASPTSIVSGQSSLLSWSSTNATSCTGTNFSTNNATSGTLRVSPTATTTYSVTCTGAGGTTNPATATVTVATGGVSMHLDLNSGSSGPTASGYTGVPLVAYSSARGYGWQSIAAMDSRNRTGVATLVGSLKQDFHKPTGASGSYDSHFLVDLPNGAYSVTVYLGDGDAALTNQYVDAQGIKAVGPVSTTTCATSVTTCSRSFTFLANVTNGQLDLRFYTTNATSVYYGYIAVEGIDVVSAGP